MSKQKVDAEFVEGLQSFLKGVVKGLEVQWISKEKETYSIQLPSNLNFLKSKGYLRYRAL